MKVLDLRCAQGHGFEGWFASHEDFDAQQTRGLVECPMCADRCITKQLSAPRLNLGKTQESAAKADATAVRADPQELQGLWMRAMRDLLENTENVGERFVDEARKMHYGETPERSIRGQTTPEQAQALLEEGIAVMQLDIPDGFKETLQ